MINCIYNTSSTIGWHVLLKNYLITLCRIAELYHEWQWMFFNNQHFIATIPADDTKKEEKVSVKKYKVSLTCFTTTINDDTLEETTTT